MSYQVGVDVGGTFTTAAVCRGGRAEVVKVVPSRLPGVPRGFLRRVGDDTPVLVGARPVPAETLVAQLVSQVLATLGKPASLAVTHPVPWGPHRVAALRAALGEVTMVSTAAAVAYQSTAPTAVHDLGGTTFTAAVVHGLATVGQPTELDLGGADLDELVFDHIRNSLGDVLPTDPAALARLRQDCTRAKETLSADTEVEIPVAGTRVRLTRAEFEDMARPLLAETAAALRVTIEESGVTPATVLLTGGAAWLPLLTQVVSAELGRPVTATPPGAAAMGAALAAAGVPVNQPGLPNLAGIPGAGRPAAPRPATPSAIPGAASLGAASPFENDGSRRPTPSREPLPGNGFTNETRTSLVEPVRPPVPAAIAPLEPTTKRPRTMIAAVAATFVVIGGAAGIAFTSGQTPAGAGAETRATTSTVTRTVAATTTTDAVTAPAGPPTRQAPPRVQPSTKVMATTAKAATTTTTIAKDTTTTTTATATTTTSVAPANSRTSEGGR
jgi:molecular chaperone DnaK